MPNYEKIYHILFNAITDAIDSIESLKVIKAKEILVEAQKRTEEQYICADEKLR